MVLARIIQVNEHGTLIDCDGFIDGCRCHSYPDLFREDVRKYFASQYALNNFPGTTEDVMLWNDMNEPSVFNGPEITMPKGKTIEAFPFSSLSDVR